MAWYPRAKKWELQPESDTQAAIRPTQFIVHSIIAPWTAKRVYEYWRDSTNLESHFGIGYEAGDVGQFIGTQTRADANAGANRRGDGTGAVSAETASNLQGSDPWTDAQVEELIRLGVWLHEEHGIPLRICRSHTDPGFGYHSMFSQWSTSGTACPGKARIQQFKAVVFPGIVARATGKTTNDPSQEDDMPLSAADIDKIADEVEKRTYNAVWRKDVMTPPTGAETKDNPTWAAESVLRDAANQGRSLRTTVAAQGVAITQLAAAIAARDTAVDVDALIARIETAIANIDINLTANGA